MPSSLSLGCSRCMRPIAWRANPDVETTDWRARRGKTAHRVRREGTASPFPTPIPRPSGDSRERQLLGSQITRSAGVHDVVVFAAARGCLRFLGRRYPGRETEYWSRARALLLEAQHGGSFTCLLLLTQPRPIEDRHGVRVSACCQVAVLERIGFPLRCGT